MEKEKETQWTSQTSQTEEVSKMKKELEKLAKPLLEYLKENYHPYTAIVITDEQVAIVETTLSIPSASLD